MYYTAFTLTFLLTVGSLLAESIHGVKWHDRNGNAQRDPNEPGLPGVTIYIDSNSNGEVDPKEPQTITMRDDPNTRFDESGLYWIENLRPGRHVVREVVPDGFVQTFPRLGLHDVTLNRGVTAEGIDFGNQAADSGSIHGVKWHDENGNARRDSNEPGLPGVIIYLDSNNNGRLDEGEPQTVTMRDDPNTALDEAGLYWLVSLSAGKHVVREVVPEGFVQTFPEPLFHSVELETGEVAERVDFGNQAANANGGSIHGTKWLDRNGNGRRDADEPGLPGVVIYIDRNGNAQLDADEAATRTMADDPNTAFDESGLYWLEGISPGRHVVREVVPDGFVQTYPLRVGFHAVALSTGQIIEGIDFGNQSVNSGSIHGTKWLDRNGNARRDTGEPGLPGVVIYVDRNENGQLDADEPATRTIQDDPNTAFDESGHYWLENLSPGNHIVREIVPDGFMQTFPPALGAHEIGLSTGEVVEGVDFGNRATSGGSIHGVKWLDRNGNGRRDANEPGLAGVVIYIDQNGNGRHDAVEPATRTMDDDLDTDFDEAGLYWLQGLSPGEHVIREVVPDGFAQTFPGALGAHVVELAIGESVDGADFGNQSVIDGAIHGTKWLDLNGNAQRDRNEPGLAGVTIYVDHNQNSRLDRDEPRTVTMQDDPNTASDESGRYWLEGLRPGRHIVREVVPDGFVQTFPIAPNSHVVALNVAETAGDIDFGNKRNVGKLRILKVEKVDRTLLILVFAPSGHRYFEQTSSNLKNWTKTGYGFDGDNAERTLKVSMGRGPLFVRYVSE